MTNPHTISEEQVLNELKTTKKGLSRHEAEVRLHTYGLNELKVVKLSSPFKIFMQQFASPLVWILLLALAVSIFLQEYVDASVIGLIVIVNAILGFVQEYRAERAIEALKKMASLKATVLREGKEMKIDATLLVPGDLIILETGEKVPADARLLEVHQMHVQEAALTGESQPVTKKLGALPEKTALAERFNMIYSSTIISQGRGLAVVTGTGMKTEVGKIAKLIQEAHEKLTPLQKKLRDLGKYLTIAVVIVAVIVFLAGILSGKAATVMFLTAIALAVAAIPEGLPAVITISLALGIQRMSRKNALVRKMPSVETLGSVTVICTDKTGTLTHNEMTVTHIFSNNTSYQVTGSGYEPKGTFLNENKLANPEPLHQLLKIGALCNDAHFTEHKENRELFGDPTEAALIVSAEKAGFTKEELKKEARIDEIPFTSERKMMTTIHKDGKKTVSYTKGAPDVIIERCNRILLDGKVVRLNREKKKLLLKQNETYAKQALRVLAFSYNHSKKPEDDMVFVGLQAMIDPPREEVKAALKRCNQAGIRVMMITGDHLTTAKAIANELGISGKAVTGQEISEMKNLKESIKSIAICARVNPEHKLRIVEALKSNGEVVAMTGDGVNDAPALKKADIGVAMGISGTDVAREAADMILTDDNFTSIVNAVEEGRGIFDNIRKFVNYLLSSNLGEIAVILFASIWSSVAGLHLALPLTAIQILWINLVTDGLPATALSLDPHAQGIMQKPPRPPRESILSKELRWSIITFGILIGIVGLTLFLLYQGSGVAKAQTIVFTSLVLFELVRLQTIRGEYKLGWFSNKWLVVAVVVSILLQLATIYTPLNQVFKTTPLTLWDWAVLLTATICLLLVYKLINLIARKFTK